MYEFSSGWENGHRLDFPESDTKAEFGVQDILRDQHLYRKEGERGTEGGAELQRGLGQSSRELCSRLKWLCLCFPASLLLAAKSVILSKAALRREVALCSWGRPWRAASWRLTTAHTSCRHGAGWGSGRCLATSTSDNCALVLLVLLPRQPLLADGSSLWSFPPTSFCCFPHLSFSPFILLEPANGSLRLGGSRRKEQFQILASLAQEVWEVIIMPRHHSLFFTFILSWGCSGIFQRPPSIWHHCSGDWWDACFVNSSVFNIFLRW